MDYALKLDAPIMSGQSAAGVTLGDSIDDILLTTMPIAVSDMQKGKCYSFDSIILWTNGEGKVKQIGLYPGYQGKIQKVIGIGSTIGETIALLGMITEDEEDNLVIQGSPGLCFESSQWIIPNQSIPDPSAIITAIFVFEIENNLSFKKGVAA